MRCEQTTRNDHIANHVHTTVTTCCYVSTFRTPHISVPLAYIAFRPLSLNSGEKHVCPCHLTLLTSRDD